MLKKSIAIIVVLVLCIANFSVLSSAVTDTDVSLTLYEKAGDINDDGKVNASDALCALRYSVGKMELTPEQVIRADISYHYYIQFGPVSEKLGTVDAFDALIMLHCALRGWPPPEWPHINPAIEAEI